MSVKTFQLTAFICNITPSSADRHPWWTSIIMLLFELFTLSIKHIKICLYLVALHTQINAKKCFVFTVPWSTFIFDPPLNFLGGLSVKNYLNKLFWSKSGCFIHHGKQYFAPTMNTGICQSLEVKMHSTAVPVYCSIHPASHIKFRTDHYFFKWTYHFGWPSYTCKAPRNMYLCFLLPDQYCFKPRPKAIFLLNKRRNMENVFLTHVNLLQTKLTTLRHAWACPAG